MDKYKSIHDYITYLENNLELQICIKDVAGFLRTPNQLNTHSQHHNKFCTYIKSHNTLWDKCLLTNQKIYEKCKIEQKPFYGMCYCGIEEYIVPIISQNQCVGFICVGEFSSNRTQSENRMKSISQKFGIPINKLNNTFSETIANNTPNKDTVMSLIQILADLLSSYYSSFLLANKDKLARNKETYKNKTYIISHALQYIQMNYSKSIHVKDIAKYCHCSESYINHIFKKTIKVNVKSYINQLRIIHAKTLLEQTDHTITEISEKIGFKDPNYFSNVFSQIVGICATKYRQECNNDNTK